MGIVRQSNQAKKEYLRQYRHLIAEQREVEEEIHALMLDYALPSSPGFEPHTPSGSPHDLSDYAVKCDILYDRLRRIRSDKWFTQTEIMDKIEEMGDAVERRLLYLRYIKGLGFRAIAEILGYSEERIWHKHGDALTHFVL